MEGFDYGKAMTDFWASSSRGFLAAGESAMRAMREGAAAMGGQPSNGMPAHSPGGPAPDTSGFDASFGADMEDAAKATQAIMDLWSSALGMSATLAGSFPQGGAEDEGTAAATFRRMVDPRAWMAGDGLDEALQRLAVGPRLADLGDAERRYAKVSRTWLEMRRRSMEHNAVVLEGWLRAGRGYAERASRLGAEDGQPSQRRLLDLWVETANASLLEMQRSERFLGTQAALLKASTELRFAQREIAEHYAESFGLPTRRELDDVHRSLTELRRELRASQRQARVAAEAAHKADQALRDGLAATTARTPPAPVPESPTPSAAAGQRRAPRRQRTREG